MLKKEEEKKGGKNDNKKAGAQPAKKFDMFDDMMGGDDDSDGCDLMDFDFQAPPQAPKPTALKSQPTIKETQSQGLNKPATLAWFKLPTQSYRARLSSKLRQSLIMHLTLLIFAYLNNKFFICRDLLSQENMGNIFKVY